MPGRGVEAASRGLPPVCSLNAAPAWQACGLPPPFNLARHDCSSVSLSSRACRLPPPFSLLLPCLP